MSPTLQDLLDFAETHDACYLARGVIRELIAQTSADTDGIDAVKEWLLINTQVEWIEWFCDKTGFQVPMDRIVDYSNQSYEAAKAIKRVLLSEGFSEEQARAYGAARSAVDKVLWRDVHAPFVYAEIRRYFNEVLS